MFDAQKRVIEQVLFLGNKGHKYAVNYVNHSPGTRGYNIEFKRTASPFAQVEMMVGVPEDKIMDQLEEIAGRPTLIVRYYFGDSIDDQIENFMRNEVQKKDVTIDRLASLVDHLTNEIQRIPSEIRSDEFTNNKLEQIRQLTMKFQQKSTPDLASHDNANQPQEPKKK